MQVGPQLIGGETTDLDLKKIPLELRTSDRNDRVNAIILSVAHRTFETFRDISLRKRAICNKTFESSVLFAP